MFYVNYILIKLGFDGAKGTNGESGQDTMQMEKSATASEKVGASGWRLGTKDHVSSVQGPHFSVPTSHFNSTNGLWKLFPGGITI